MRALGQLLCNTLGFLSWLGEGYKQHQVICPHANMPKGRKESIEVSHIFNKEEIFHRRNPADPEFPLYFRGQNKANWSLHPVPGKRGMNVLCFDSFMIFFSRVWPSSLSTLLSDIKQNWS